MFWSRTTFTSRPHTPLNERELSPGEPYNVHFWQPRGVRGCVAASKTKLNEGRSRPFFFRAVRFCCECSATAAALVPIFGDFNPSFFFYAFQMASFVFDHVFIRSSVKWFGDCFVWKSSKVREVLKIEVGVGIWSFGRKKEERFLACIKHIRPRGGGKPWVTAKTFGWPSGWGPSTGGNWSRTSGTSSRLVCVWAGTGESFFWELHHKNGCERWQFCGGFKK